MPRYNITSSKNLELAPTVTIYLKVLLPTDKLNLLLSVLCMLLVYTAQGLALLLLLGFNVILDGCDNQMAWGLCVTHLASCDASSKHFLQHSLLPNFSMSIFTCLDNI